ncbi:MAG: hypothetical protein L3K26_16360, partial [Candidatus Hydrogenedentes bacterium]|nr:hypothetical protein [Candidatus Hydrogenedentota bacterium]
MDWQNAGSATGSRVLFLVSVHDKGGWAFQPDTKGLVDIKSIIGMCNRFGIERQNTIRASNNR